MVVISQIQGFINVNDRERKISDMTVLDKYIEAFHFIPMIDGPVGIAHEVCGRIIGQAHIFPVRDAIR